MKYSLPGHSSVQEVDNAHSVIEKAMQKTDFYSPIGLIRILKSINPKNPYRVLQMKPSDFKDYAVTAKLFNYKDVPFTQVASVKFTQSYSDVFYKTSHDPLEPENCGNIKHNETPNRKTKKKSQQPLNVFSIKPSVSRFSQEISKEKQKDIKAAFPYMPLIDREYYTAIFN